MKKFFLFITVLFGISVSKAQDINSYKYVIVPQEFQFLQEPDQYKLNSLTKFLLEKNGFEAFFESEDLPEEVSKNPCEALVAGVENNSGLFRTKVNLILKDCYNKQIFISEEGVSRKKDFTEAYHEALRNAFQSLEELNYSYNETIVSGRPEMPKISENGEEETDKPGIGLNSETVNRAEDYIQVKNFSDDAKLIFTRNSSKYLLKKTSKGYNFYQEGMEEPFAALVKSSSGVNFIYSAINSQGMAHFDDGGNLVVEVLNSETGALDSVTYKLQH